MIVYNQQELVHNRPIISMEQFLEKVAWPEAQLRLKRAHKVVPPRPIPARTEPTLVEPQPLVVHPQVVTHTDKNVDIPYVFVFFCCRLFFLF